VASKLNIRSKWYEGTLAGNPGFSELDPADVENVDDAGNLTVCFEVEAGDQPALVLWYNGSMRVTLRQARTRAGISMSDLANRLGVSVSTVSTLELHDERGTAKAATTERALQAMNLARWDIVLPARELERIIADCQEITDQVAWQMAVENQTISPEDERQILERLVRTELASR